ncbi:MAG: PqqD family protein [Heyndrickxia sp.]
MNSKYMCPSSIEMMEIDDEWIVMNTEQFTITKLNSMGAWILKNIKENLTIQEMIDEISNNFSVDKLAVESDIQDFIEDLEKKGLIKNAGKPSI